MTVSLEAPALAGSRPRAQQLLVNLPQDLTGEEVHLRCGFLIAAAPSFVDEIIKELLVVRHAKLLCVTDATDQEFVDYLRERASVHGVAEKVLLPSS